MNRLPSLVPRLSQTVAGRVYQTRLTAVDPDDDTIIWSLIESPPSLAIGSDGNITWSPTLDDIGTHSIGVRASDLYGAYDEYHFDLVVRGTNSPARIEGNPPSLHRVETTLSVPFFAFDPDQDEVVFRFTPGSESHGAMLNEQSGELLWTPSATGHYPFRISAVDSFGEGSTIAFAIDVDPFGPNQPPEFVSTQPGIAEAGLIYSRTFTAVDPEGLALQYRVDSGPEGMTIDQQGVLLWTPANELVGQSFSITLSATDPGGKVARYRIELPVREPNQSPTFTSSPPTQITAGQTLAYDLKGFDENGDPLTFDYVSGPPLVTLDRDNARLTWQTASDDIGSYEIVVSLTDQRIASPILQRWTMDVTADQQPPTVTVNADSTNVVIGQRVVYLVTANDNVLVAQRSLTVSGLPLSLDSHGYAVTEFSAPGRYLAIAAATDSSGNTSSTQEEIVVRNPNDSAPQLQIVFPTSSSRVTDLIDIRLQLQDAEDQLSAIRAFIEPLDGRTNRSLLFEQLANPGEFLPPMFDEVAGQFDPTSFRNGSYRITVEAEDSSANISTASTTINIEGTLKLGTYTAGFVDLAIPLPGFPLLIQRVYNSLDADRLGDFGRGWNLDYGLASIQVDLDTLGGLGSGRYAAFVDGTRIHVSLPDGQSEGFTFQAIPGRRVGGTVIDYRPAFVSDAGVRSLLHGPDQTLVRLGNSYVTDEGITYNPFDPAIGNFFQHETSDGTVRTIRASSNTLLSIADRNGNEIAFEAEGLVSNRDKSVVIERDYRDRIAAIIDPRGNRITYQYDSLDRLIAVTDRDQNSLPENARRSTTYIYDDNQPFLLVQASDADGVVLFKNEVDSSGKLVGQFNAFEGGVSSRFNTIDREQSIEINGTTVSTTHYDSEGRLQNIEDYSHSNLVFEFSESGKPRSLTRNLFDPQNARAIEQLQFTLQLDDAGRVLSRTAPNGNTSFYTYDPFTGQVASEVDPLGNRTQYQYDDKGNLVATTDSKDQMVRYDYDEIGNVIGAYAVDLTDGSNDGCQSTTNFQALCPATTTLFTATFDASGKLTSKTDEIGNVTVFQYDANNLVVRTETSNAIDPDVVLVESTTLNANDFPTIEQTFRQLPSGSITSLNQSQKQFDSSGRVLSERTPTGQRAAVEYDAAGRPVITRSIDLDSEILISYTIFDDQDRPSIQTNPVPEGQIPVTGKRYHYDLSSQIIRTDTLQGLSIIVSEYAGKPNIELIQLGQVFAGSTVAPDGLNHPILIESEDGRSVERIRNHEGHTIESRTTVRDVHGGQTTRISRTVYDRFDRVLTATDPYDEFSDAPITGITNVYSATGEILRSDQLTDLRIDIVQLADGTMQSIVTNPGRLLQNDRLRFDDAGRLLYREEPDGSRTEYHYDGQGRPVEILNLPSSANGITYSSRTYYAEDDSFVMQIQRTPHSEASETVNATRIYRDAAGRTVRSEFVRNVRTEVFTEIGGRYRIELIDAGIVDSWSTTTFDITGHPIVEINDLGGRTDYTYDELGNTTSVTGPSYFDIDLATSVRPRTEHLFEGSRLLATKAGLRVLANGTVDQGMMRLTQFVYNDRGEITATLLPNGESIYAANNQAGQRTSETDMAGLTTQYEYSATGALSAIIQPLVESSSSNPYYPRTEFEYDDWGNRIVTRTGVAQHLDGTLDYSSARESKDSYNSQGQLISIARSSELVEQRSYNEDGRIDFRLHPDGVVEAFEWSADPLDPGFSKTNFYRSLLDYENGLVADFNQSTTDTLGNTQQTYGSGTTSRTYDEHGRLIALNNGAGTIHYQYSSSGRLIATWTNDPQEQLVQNRVRYDYDSAGRLATVSLTEKFGIALTPPETYKYSYNPFGQISQLVHPDGMIERHEYDSMGNTTGITHFAGDTTPNTVQDNPIVAIFEYSLNAAGLRSEATESFWDESSSIIIESRHWLAEYDQANRLIRYEVSDNDSHSVTTYEYDPAHNRTRTSVDLDADGQLDTSTQYRYDAADRLLEELTSNRETEFFEREYQYRPGSSNPATIIERSLATDQILATTNYEYDYYGYLTLEEHHSFGDVDSIRRVETTYDPNGRLIRQHEVRTQDSDILFDQAIHFIVDELSPTGYSQLFETRDAASREPVTAIATGLRVLSEFRANSDSSTLITDAMGSVRGVRNLQTGELTVKNYSAFGEAIEGANAGSLHGFAGELHDRESDTVYLRKRTYTPSTGRFLQADSFAGVATQPASLNRYIYAANSPFHFADPSGNLFVLIDGTWNHDSAAHLEPGEDFTNVYYLREAFASNNNDQQFVYERGVGNPFDNQYPMTFFGGAFGLGLSEITNRIVNRSKERLNSALSPLFVTGFSRGAVSALQFTHAIEREVPNVDINFMGLFDPVASVGFPGNGVNFGFNLELSRSTRAAFTLVSFQEDRGYFPGTNLHSKRATQWVTWGVHSDVGGGYATAPTAIIKDSLYYMHASLASRGLTIPPTGQACLACGPKSTHYPHPILTYIKHGGQTFGEIARPMVEYPMPGELGMAFFFDEMNFRRVGTSELEALAIRTLWIPSRVFQIYVLSQFINLTPAIGGIASTGYKAWNLAALHASHIDYYLNRI
jgi:RHS repeat-associated protein